VMLLFKSCKVPSRASNSCVDGKYNDGVLMIKEILADRLDIIDPLINRLLEKSTEGEYYPPNFCEVVKTAVSEGKAFLYGAYSDDDLLLGIGMFSNVSKRISFVFADGDIELETTLVDVVFDNHSKDCPLINAGGPWINEEISNHLVKIDFKKLDRVHMTLERTSIESVQLPELSEEMQFEIYHEDQRDEVSKIIFKGNDGHIHQIFFFQHLGTSENCKNWILTFENNAFGEYKKPYSWVLRKNGQVVGACLMTIQNKGDTGYIPYIVIDPDYQGKGLGKSLLIHSMKKIIVGEPDIVKVGLDVTLENKARFLYKSVGFKNVREYSMYTWVNE